MRFVYTDLRNHREIKLTNAAIKNDWTVSDIFIKDDSFFSSYLSEEQRLKWAPILIALAFGENTAYSGFGARIANSDDISIKNWLCIHLLDESKHTDGFSSLLNYLYPSWRGRQEQLFSSRDAVKYYGYTHKTEALIEWLLCTQIAEVYGKGCYKALYSSLQDEPVINLFLGSIIKDESRHIAYIESILNKARQEIGQLQWDMMKPFIEKMIILGRNMFEARKKGANYHALKSLDIDATAFCDVAELELRNKFL